MVYTTLPRLNLAHLPTPLQEMKRLARAVNSPTRLFVKRDDCTGLAFGGNKTRKLEFSMGTAVANAADMIVTAGDVQSNHVRQTAAAAAKLGMECHCFIENTVTAAGYSTGDCFTTSGNQLLDSLLGASVHWIDSTHSDADAAMESFAHTARVNGRAPYVVPLGASDGIGSMGYVECARELVAQWRESEIAPTHVVLATGSAGTQAGLLMGLRALGVDTEVIGISVSDETSIKRDKIRAVLADLVNYWIGAPPCIADSDIQVLDTFTGPGYGIPTKEGCAAIELLSRTEGLLLDPVYTGKAMAGMLSLIDGKSLKNPTDIVFLHTGGAPALFAYPEVLEFNGVDVE